LILVGRLESKPALVAGFFNGVSILKNSILASVTALSLCLFSSQADAQAAQDPAVDACKSTGLLALQERSPDITDLVMDMESLAISKADTKVEDVSVKMVILGEAYIARKDKTGKPDRFVCLLGDKGKVLLTFFTAQ
jgi:hypothetical protein